MVLGRDTGSSGSGTQEDERTDTCYSYDSYDYSDYQSDIGSLAIIRAIVGI